VAQFKTAFGNPDNNAGVFVLNRSQVRYEGQVGEQGTMFFLDPSGNALEFKSFKNPTELFETTTV
jgi:extradiol dioxygenase family protein